MCYRATLPNRYPFVHSAASRPQHPANANCPPKSVNVNLNNALQTVCSIKLYSEGEIFSYSLKSPKLPFSLIYALSTKELYIPLFKADSMIIDCDIT